MKFYKIVNLRDSFNRADYKGMNITQFIPGSQRYSEDFHQCVIATNEIDFIGHKDVIELTQEQYLKEKEDIITKNQYIQETLATNDSLATHHNETTKNLISDNEKYKNLECKLQAVMYSVDKWFDDVDESKDEVNRAADAREIALKAIEDRDALISEIIDKIEIIREKHLDLTHHNNYPRTVDVCNEITNLIDKFYNPDKGE